MYHGTATTLRVIEIDLFGQARPAFRKPVGFLCRSASPTTSLALSSAARPLDPNLRDPFLRSVADALQGQTVIGPGVVARVCADMQRQFFTPPDLSAG